MRLWGDGKSKGCLMLAELELDTVRATPGHPRQLPAGR